MTILDALRHLLADTFRFYAIAHIAHWNVTGRDFPDKHAFLGELYAELQGMVDDVAEHIRAQDAPAPGTLGDLLRPAELADANPGTTWPTIRSALLTANGGLVDCLTEACDAAMNANDQGLCNYLAERLDRHAKLGWQLRASQ